MGITSDMRTLVRRPSALGADFNRLWSAQAASLTGAQVTEVALPLLAVITLHASPGVVGALGVARWLPYVLLALPLGVVVDRRRRRALMVGSDLARLLLTGALVVTAITGALTTSLLLVLVFAVGAFAVLFEVAYQSFLPTVARREHLEAANGRLQATAAVSQMAGPGLGGALVQVLTAPLALLAHGLAYALSALAITRIGVPEPPAPPADAGFWTQLREGVRFTRSDRYLFWLAGFSGIYNLFEQAIMVVFTLYAVRELGLTPAAIGLVLALGATGAVAGAGLTGPALRRLGAGRLMLACATAESLALFAIPLTDATWPRTATIGVLAAGFAVNGAGTASSSIVALTLRQVRTPDALMGRVNAVVRWLSYGSIALGAALGGALATNLGLRTALSLACIGLLSTAAWVALSPLRGIRDTESVAR
jgi:MFS family permease